MNKKILILVIPMLFIVVGISLRLVKGNTSPKDDGVQIITVDGSSSKESDNNETTVPVKIVVGTIPAEDTTKDDTNENETSLQNQTESEVTTEPETTDNLISYIVVETTVPETKPEPTTKKIKKKKRKKEIENTTQEKTTKKKTTKKKEKMTTKKISKPKVTKPSVKSLGTYYESNVLSSSKVSIIRNSVRAKCGGSQNTEKTNLARYMSANQISNASSTYKSLTGGSKSLRAKTYSTTIESNSQDNVLTAANKLAGKVSGVSSSYGIGVSSFKAKLGYKVYVVIVY